MLAPRKPKHRKQMTQANRIKQPDTRGCEIDFGEFGLRALEPGWISNRQIEAARIAIARHARRGGKIWIRIFPDKPLTSKPAETRMGKGKGAPESWVAEVRPGRIMYELTGVEPTVAREALRRAAAKLPVRCRIEQRSNRLVA